MGSQASSPHPSAAGSVPARLLEWYMPKHYATAKGANTNGNPPPTLPAATTAGSATTTQQQYQQQFEACLHHYLPAMYHDYESSEAGKAPVNHSAAPTAAAVLREPVKAATAACKYLLVYVHSGEHEDTSEFVRRCLLAPSSSATPSSGGGHPQLWERLEELCLLHMVDATDAAAGGPRLVSDWRVESFPFMALLVKGRVVGCIEGRFGPSALLSFLDQCHRTVGAIMHQEIAIRHERQSRDVMRAMQAQALEEAEAKDRAMLRQLEEDKKNKKKAMDMEKREENNAPTAQRVDGDAAAKPSPLSPVGSPAAVPAVPAAAASAGRVLGRGTGESSSPAMVPRAGSGAGVGMGAAVGSSSSSSAALAAAAAARERHLQFPTSPMILPTTESSSSDPQPTPLLPPPAQGATTTGGVAASPQSPTPPSTILSTNAAAAAIARRSQEAQQAKEEVTPPSMSQTQQQQEQQQKDAHEICGLLPPEPPADAPLAAIAVIKLVDLRGKATERRFYRTDPVTAVFALARATGQSYDGGVLPPFKLMAGFPPKPLPDPTTLNTHDEPHASATTIGEVPLLVPRSVVTMRDATI